MNYVVALVPLDEVKRAWHRAAPWLAPAVAQSGGRYDMASLFDFIVASKGRLWLVLGDDGAVHAAFTTHIAHYPRKDILAVDFIGGDGVAEWLTAVTDTLDRYAIAHQLAGLETCARTGWKHLLKARGWTQPMAWYEKGAPASGAEQE